jgi:hypothetical protein
MLKNNGIKVCIKKTNVWEGLESRIYRKFGAFLLAIIYRKGKND